MMASNYHMYSDVCEDAIPEPGRIGDGMSPNASCWANSAKDMLKQCGLTREEIEVIASAYGENLHQAAEKAEQLSKSNVGKDQLFKVLISGKETVQQNVQDMIQKALSDDSCLSSSNVSSVRPSERPMSSQQSSVNSSSESSLPDLKQLDVEVDESDLPNELKDGQYDIFLFFSEVDYIEALKFKYFLEKELDMKVLYLGDNLANRRGQFDTLEDAIDRSLYMFIFVTKNMIEDLMLKYKHDAALARSIETNGEFVVPVRAENCPIPFSLQPLTALRVYHIMSELPEDSTESIDWNSSTAKQIPFVKNQIVKLVRAKERLKRRREQMDEQKKDEWIQNEKVRLFREQEVNKLRQERLDMQRAMEIKAIKEDAKKYRENLEEMVRQEMEKNKGERDHMQRANVAAQQAAAASQIAILRQMGMFDAANALQAQQMMGTGYPPYYGVPVYHTPPMPSSMQIPFPSFVGQVPFNGPSGVNPADMVNVVQPAVNIQVQHLQNLQVGDRNKIAPDATPPSDNDAQFVQGVPAPQTTLGEESIQNPDIRPSEDSGSPSAERQLPTFNPIVETTRPVAETDDQTLVKRQISGDSTVVSAGPVFPQQQGKSVDEGALVSSVEFPTGTYSESRSMTQSGEDPPPHLSSLSVHNFESATEHLHHPPGEYSSENREAQMRNPLSLVDQPPEALDSALSVRSLAPQRGSNHPPSLPSAENHFHISMNQSQASVDIS